MPSRRPTRLRQRPEPRHLLMLIPVGLIVGVCVADVVAPPSIHLGPLLVAAPALTAAFAGPGPTAAIGVLAIAAQVGIGLARDVLFTENLVAQTSALIVVSALVFLFTVVRERNERRLSRSRSVAGVAQQVLLRPLPARSGDLEIASLYLPAEEEAEMGGDLFAAARTSASTRLIIGDVRGKGLPAYSHAALILGAFRAAAHRQATLPRLARHLDGAVRWDSSQWRTAATSLGDADVDSGSGAGAGAGVGVDVDVSGAGRGGGVGGVSDGSPVAPRPDVEPDADPASDAGPIDETFATVALFDIPDRRPELNVVSCGHPPALLLREGRAHVLDPRCSALPIGLGPLAGPPDYEVETFPLRPGDLLLLYTDGVTEARNADGDFYPLTERAGAWCRSSPHHVLRRLREELFAHTGGRLADDAAAVAVRRLPSGSGRAPRRRRRPGARDGDT
ncbi:PP2C family protein-serine/threonine phosphatase [Streptomyces sp. WZ-12]|uniref:PP2C family protein-serine/threonine phosphatase n=1 Tax=Streptomyces sp. WZ-12 TaxID=3030210 RepID=UPI0023817051|nr:PP2C family protein-serine/threonine phosphatase [Streptomyces sp. WZ-12]